MIWNIVGNKWFDSWIRKFCDFSIELNSCASHNFLTFKEREDLTKVMEKLNKINQKIKKRVNGTK